MDYRELYKKHYNLNFNEQYEVHHIDGNRGNNNFANLVLLPKSLHQKYHAQKQLVENYPLCTQITGNGCGVGVFNIYTEQFLETLKECNKWYDYKSYLDGKIPNIHNIEIGD